MRRMSPWILGAGLAMAAFATPAAAQVHVDVGVLTPNVGARVAIGAPDVYVVGPPEPVYVPGHRAWKRKHARSWRKDARERYWDRREDYREYAKDRREAEREYLKDLREAQREYEKDRREAEREYEKDFREAQREYEKELREARRDRYRW